MKRLFATERILAALFALAVLFSFALASVESARAETTWTTQIVARFATVEEGQQRMRGRTLFHDQIAESILPFFLQKKGGTLEEYIEYSEEQVMEFTPEEEQRIIETLAWLKDTLEAHDLELPDPGEITFVKTTGQEAVGSAGYTSEGTVFLWFIGSLYYYGYGVEQSYEKALEYFQRAAEMGNVRALNSIGYMYLDGEGVDQDYQKALECIQSAVDQGEIHAQKNMGHMYLYGLGVDQDYEKALEYYQLAADQGEEESQCWVAIMYHAGEVVSQDYGKALKYYQLAADQGNAIALNNLGDMYENGNGVDQDYSKALEYYRLAADQGLGDAFIGLGDLYRDGRGVEQDDGKAAEYYGKALELGIDIAEERLNELEAKQ